MDVSLLEALKDFHMKKKLLVLLIAVTPTLIPNLASAVAIDVWDWRCYYIDGGLKC